MGIILVAINCASERNGETTIFIRTKGFKDYIFIGDQTRPNVFKSEVRKAQPLYEAVLEIYKRVTLGGDPEGPRSNRSSVIPMNNIVLDKSNNLIRISKVPEEDAIRSVLLQLYTSCI